MVWLFSTHVCAHLKAIYPLVRGQAVSVPFRQAPRQVVPCMCVFCARVRHHTLLARPASADCPFSRLRAGAEHTPGGVLHRAFCAPASARAAIAKLGSAVVCARLHQSVGCDRCSGAPLGEPVFYCCCCCHTFRISRCIGRKEVGRVEEAKTHCRWNTNNGNASSHFLHVLGSSSSTVPRSGSFCSLCRRKDCTRGPAPDVVDRWNFWGLTPKSPRETVSTT